MEFEERYFREELDYLCQLSKLLATEKPHLARFLAEKDADPDIERLLEGVAFLTGNLRQKIEDEFPELTHGLIKMLWPNYLRPVPAMTLIEYTPDMDKSSVPVLIPRNEQFTTNAGEIRVDEVLPSDAKKEEPPPCTFTLCRDIWLLPVRLEQIENRSTTRNGVINITFSVAPGTDFRTLDLNKLRFWLGNDDNYTRDQLYLWFCEYLQGADLTVGEQHIRLPEFMLKAVGFEPQDAMLPWPKNVHSGYRILQEYFCYPDAFLFFDLCGCPALPDGLQAEFFTLQLRFSRPLPVDIRLRRDSLRLASESKDFRLLAHLLRTLQHAGDPHLALRLLALYVEHYWAVAAPQNMAHKKRFASQVIKRFETGIEGFSQNAATAQRDALSGELAKLAQCWQSHNAPELAQATDDLFALYQRAFNRAAPAPVPTPAASGSSPQTTATSESGVTQPSAPAPQIVIDSHDDKAWRDTLLKVAAILCERQPDSPQGYRLRRHALWQNITSTPQAESDGRTPLAAVSADMVADYHAQLGSADMALWQQVEKSVLLAPYWLDGHCLSAQTALRLGHKQVADAIRDEVIRFLERLPQLTGLLFNDHTPFISEQTKQWLAASPDAKVAPVAQIGEESKAARACFAEQGLEAALRYLDMLPEGDPRDQFHRQYLAAQLTEEAGLVQLAQQQYRMLFRMGLQMMVADWEPSLLEQLEQKFTAEQ
ncbi:type VI secretion system protein TssA [Escherichia coli]|nr:type VI secretion system protein TssA [Escherichia coli]